jgi:hypothetical protein
MANQINPAYPTSPYPFIDANGNPTMDSGMSTTAPVTAPLTGQRSPQQAVTAPQTQPAAQPQAQPQPATQTQPNTNVDIAPAGSAAAPPPTQPTPVVQPTSTLGPPQVQGPNPSGSAGQYTVQQLLAPFDTEFQNANQAVLDLNTTINGDPNHKDQNGNPAPIKGDAQTLQDAQNAAIPGTVDAAVQSATAKYQADMSAYSAAQQRLYGANIARQQALQKALDQDQIVPSQVETAHAQAVESGARADQIQSQIQIAQQLAPSQQQLQVSQAAQYANQALLDKANADKVSATTQSDIALATAQANQYQANANNINALIDANKQKIAADTTLTQHQVGLTDNQSAYYQASAAEQQAHAGLESAQADYQRSLIAGAPGLQAGQTAQAAGAGAEAQAQAQIGIPANAAAQLADIQQKMLGPAYGLQAQIPAIRAAIDAVTQHVFGPGGSGDETEANDLLKQYVTATISGTSPYAASVAAANAGLTAFGTQASMANAAQQAMASRANALQGAAANVIGTLGQMNANAPAGSTALAGAVQDVVKLLANAGNQYAPAPQMPSAPALPQLLQQFAGGGPQGAAGGGGQGAPLAMPSGPTFNPSPAPAPAPAPAAAPAPATSAPITINVGGSSAGPPAGQNYGASTAYSGGVAPWNAQPGPSLPGVLQQSAPLSADQATQYWHSLYSNELSSGAVQSPYQPSTPTVPGIPGLPAGLSTPTPGAAVPSGAM